MKDKKENKIVYELRTNMPLCKDIEYKVKDENIKKAIISAPNDRSTLEFEFILDDKISSLSDVRKSTRDICYKIMNVICIEHQVLMEGLIEKEVIIDGEKPGRHLEGRMMIESDFPKTIEEINKLEMLLNTDLDKYNNEYILMYRNAMQSADDSTRFILLYSILLQLRGPSQKTIDKYLLKTYDIPINEKSTKNNKKHESIFTWLRNVLGHTQKDYRDYNLDFTEITRLIENHVKKLGEIVNQEIKKEIGFL